MKTIGNVTTRKLSSADSSSDSRLQTYCRSCSVSWVSSSLRWRWMAFRCVRMRAKLSSIMAAFKCSSMMVCACPISLKLPINSRRSVGSQRNQPRARWFPRSITNCEPNAVLSPVSLTYIRTLDPSRVRPRMPGPSEIAAGAAGLEQEWAADELDQVEAILHGLDAAAILTSLRAAAFGSADGWVARISSRLAPS